MRRSAVLRGDFVLASGARSPYYVDARRVTLSSQGSRLVGELIVDALQDHLPDAVGGLSLGADPLVTATTVVGALQGRPVDGLLVRKEAKSHGTGRRVEGPLRRGMTVVVLEDTATTGSSALEAAEALRREGARVERVLALLDREQGAAKLLAENGLGLNSLFTMEELIEQADPGPTPEAEAAEAGPKKAILQCDGSSLSNPGPAGLGYVLYDESGEEIESGSRYLGKATNNVAEYEALLMGMTAAKRLGVTDLTVRMDSQLVVKQATGAYRVKEPSLRPLYERVQRAIAAFDRVRFEHVLRERNSRADALAFKAAQSGRRQASTSQKK
ncbi:MAG TPA: orotate phosphoribosyltransferase [Chloroflexota bacterium]|nr:orotate phosphoribosyltransferase [Chloroflexota bacterium]